MILIYWSVLVCSSPFGHTNKFEWMWYPCYCPLIYLLLEDELAHLVLRDEIIVSGNVYFKQQILSGICSAW